MKKVDKETKNQKRYRISMEMPLSVRHEALRAIADACFLADREKISIEKAAKMIFAAERSCLIDEKMKDENK